MSVLIGQIGSILLFIVCLAGLVSMIGVCIFVDDEDVKKFFAPPAAIYLLSAIFTVSQYGWLKGIPYAFIFPFILVWKIIKVLSPIAQ
jgi:hypothetical protein